MIAFTFVGDSWTLALKDAAQKVLAATEAAGLSKEVDGTINLKLVSDAEIAALNQKSTGKPEATDVLTFNYREDGGVADAELADIAISGDMAAKQAAAAGTDLADEVALLVLHGTLHVLGYDHATPDDKQHLDRLQHKVMEAANLTYRDFGWQA